MEIIIHEHIKSADLGQLPFFALDKMTLLISSIKNYCLVRYYGILKSTTEMSNTFKAYFIVRT
jgi:hypothetical protein